MKEKYMENKKLSLNKETIRELGDDELQLAAGGTIGLDWLYAANDWVQGWFNGEESNRAQFELERDSWTITS
jgi:hypothetical protein